MGVLAPYQDCRRGQQGLCPSTCCAAMCVDFYTTIQSQKMAWKWYQIMGRISRTPPRFSCHFLTLYNCIKIGPPQCRFAHAGQITHAYFIWQYKWHKTLKMAWTWNETFRWECTIIKRLLAEYPGLTILFMFFLGGLQKLTFLNLNGNQLHTLPSEINRYCFILWFWCWINTGRFKLNILLILKL